MFEADGAHASRQIDQRVGFGQRVLKRWQRHRAFGGSPAGAPLPLVRASCREASLLDATSPMLEIAGPFGPRSIRFHAPRARAHQRIESSSDNSP